MPNSTPNYGWNLPLVNNATDADLWGGQLNSNWSDLDTELKSVSDATILPVGSIYMNFSDSTNPATLLGYGTWTAITDKFVVARGATYTGTGGAASVTLSEANLPSSLTVTVVTGNVDDTASAGFATANSTAAGTMSQTLSSVGSGTAFDILPPYQAVYMWYRSA